MANKYFFDGTDAELYTGAQDFVTVIGKNVQAYELTTDQLATFTNASNSYGRAYLAAVSAENQPLPHEIPPLPPSQNLLENAA